MAVLTVREKKEVCACRYPLPVASQQIIGNHFSILWDKCIIWCCMGGIFSEESKWKNLASANIKMVSCIIWKTGGSISNTDRVRMICKYCNATSYYMFFWCSCFVINTFLSLKVTSMSWKSYNTLIHHHTQENVTHCIHQILVLYWG